ncbi:MAG: hypothetical protein SOH69_06915 [Olsenella sp.]|jgi:uncharacterized protein (DUF2062 family)
MVQRAIVEHRGCSYGCFTTSAILIVAALLIAVLPYVGAVAAGVGLYFLMRYIWRQYVQQRPDASSVQWGLQFAPIARKIMAALLCCALAASLMAAFAVRAGMSAETRNAMTTREQQEEPQSRNEPEAGQREESPSTITAGFVPADSEFSARLRISA